MCNDYCSDEGDADGSDGDDNDNDDDDGKHDYKNRIVMSETTETLLFVPLRSLYGGQQRHVTVMKAASQLMYAQAKGGQTNKLARTKHC